MHLIDDKVDQWCKNCKCFTTWAPWDHDSNDMAKHIFVYTCTTCFANSRMMYRQP